MSSSETTCWTQIEAAAAGSPDAREEFARRYYGLAWAFFAARWKGSHFFEFVDDGVHEMFVRCFCTNGALTRADRGSHGGFRPFFYGMARNVARKIEERRARQAAFSGDTVLGAIASNESRCSATCDRSWAEFIMQQAAEIQLERARERDEAAISRVELLRLRFEEGLPIREIAKKWNVEPARLHREASMAKDEFKNALQEVIAFHSPGTPGEILRECERLVSLFQ